MKNHETFTLIEGEFLPKDSREILFSVFKSKIRFHRMNNFSFQERFGKEDKHSHQRITQLENTLEEISKLLDVAEKEGKILEIKSEIYLNLLDAEENSI